MSHRRVWRWTQRVIGGRVQDSAAEKPGSVRDVLSVPVSTVRPMLGSDAFVGFIPVRNLDAARAFYCDALGLPLVRQTPEAVVVTAGAVSLRLTAVPDFAPQPFTVGGWVVSDISSTVAALKTAGVTTIRYHGMDQDGDGVWTAPSGDRVAWFADPDGNVLSITSSA